MSKHLLSPEVVSSVENASHIYTYTAGIATGALALILGRRLKKSEQKRLQDAKTGLLNYPAFQEEFEKRTGSIRRSKDENRIHGLILGDIDDFKALNTRLSHSKTDKLALIPTAEAFRKLVRPEGDVVARFGGEEFVALLSDTDLEGVEHVSTKLHDAVNSIQPETGSHLGMTIAYTTFHQGTSLEELMVGLSHSLTMAKQVSGKNQVVALNPASIA